MVNKEHSKPLEQRIIDEEPAIDLGTKRAIACNKPFMFLENLAKTGEYMYGVNHDDSFMFGADASLDFYNKRKEYTGAKLSSLKHGARCIIRYVANNMEIYNEE